MKVLYLIIPLAIISSLCCGQSTAKRPVISMKKENPVIKTVQPEQKIMSKEERQIRTSMSIRKNQSSLDTKEPLPSSSVDEKKKFNETMKNTKTPKK
jgi:hypothetical protein